MKKQFTSTSQTAETPNQLQFNGQPVAAIVESFYALEQYLEKHPNCKEIGDWQGFIIVGFK